jgi:hypothetical protein
MIGRLLALRLPLRQFGAFPCRPAFGQDAFQEVGAGLVWGILFAPFAGQFAGDCGFQNRAAIVGQTLPCLLQFLLARLDFAEQLLDLRDDTTLFGSRSNRDAPLIVGVAAEARYSRGLVKRTQPLDRV